MKTKPRIIQSAMTSGLLLFCTIGWLGTGPTARAAEKKEGALDGKSFVGEVGKKDSRKMDKDTFIFSNGTFRSSACDTYGFDSAPYTATQEGSMIKFETETTSPDAGKMNWSGAVAGDKIEGTVVWHRPQKWYNFFLSTTEEKVFRGDLQK